MSEDHLTTTNTTATLEDMLTITEHGYGLASTKDQYIMRFDAEDQDLLSGLHLATTTSPGAHTRYVYTCVSRKRVWIHRLLAGAKEGEVVDHINGDGLDNRKANLRVCSPSQNLWNQRLSRLSTSGVKGVHWHKGKRKWTGRVRAYNKNYDIKGFDTIEEAAEAIRVLRERLHGEFARHR